tara:strand:- start:1142 stop:1438 length:297 start_codon:yes stop_codon:yes gene_type:complete
MDLDHDAIYKSHPTVVAIDDSAGAFDKNGNSVTLDQNKIDEARVILDAEYAALEYSRKRVEQYASLEQQMDMQYWDSVNGTTIWKDHIAKVKSDNPKP